MYTIQVPRPKNPNLVLVNLRLRRGDVVEAKEHAVRMAVPYQHVIRGWVAAGAAMLRSSTFASVSFTSVVSS